MNPCWACAFLFASLAGPVCAGDGAVIQRVSGSSCVFADRAAGWRVALTDTNVYEGTVVWELVLGGGVVARREQNVAIRPETPATADLQVDLPAVRVGVEVAGRVTVNLRDDRQQHRSEFVLPVWTFGRDPAAQQKQWLQDQNIRVYDPDGKTLKKLNELGWPCQQVANPAAFESLGTATLIIGEGCSLRAQRGLMENALRAAQRGTHVVFLAPADGEFIPPGPGAGPDGPLALHFYDTTLVQRLDKRLESPLSRVGLQPTGSRAGALVTVDPTGGWCGFEVRWANGGALLLTGFGLLDTWEESPVPRYLLFKMLEYITPHKEKEP